MHGRSSRRRAVLLVRTSGPLAAVVVARAPGEFPRSPLDDETTEEVRGQISRAVSGQPICVGRRSEALRTAAFAFPRDRRRGRGARSSLVFGYGSAVSGG